MKENHSIDMLCQTLAVSPSGYYDWQARQRQPGLRALADQALLRRQGQRHGRNRIAD
jgi:hypothetical protein